MMEKDMYPILKKYFENKGFTVKGEVNDVDLMAIKNNSVVLIEMKTSFNTLLIAQGIRRNPMGDLVYLSIPKPTDKVLKSRTFKDKCLILKHLQLGLILVDTKYNTLNFWLDPTAYTVRNRKKKKQALLKEFHARTTDTNIGGSHKTKIMTAYRELALLALDYMKNEPRSTKALRDYTNRKKVVDILQKNHYGWFNRVSRGVYEITSRGKDALQAYEPMIKPLKEAYYKNNDDSNKD